MRNITMHNWNGLDGLINDLPFMPWATPEQQAMTLMEMAEQDEERLGPTERSLVLDYAVAIRDYRRVRDLISELCENAHEAQYGSADPMMQAYIQREITAAIVDEPAFATG